MKKKIALFYVLVTTLCLISFAFVLLHALGYRINRSDSLPGIAYRITPLGEGEAVYVGDSVLIDLSKIFNPVIEGAIERGYVTRTANQPMLKRIGAIPGDEVALTDGFLSVNGEAAKITIASRDSYGEKLFAYPTPITLQPGWYWLVSDPERGFDSRYFGPLPREAFTHKAETVF